MCPWDGVERRKDRKRMQPENLKPINGQILVVDDLIPDKVGTLYLPENKEPAHIRSGVVLATSPVRMKDGTISPCFVERSNRVIYTQFAGANNTFDHEKRIYRIIKPEELLAVIV